LQFENVLWDIEGKKIVQYKGDSMKKFMILLMLVAMHSLVIASAKKPMTNTAKSSQPSKQVAKKPVPNTNKASTSTSIKTSAKPLDNQGIAQYTEKKLLNAFDNMAYFVVDVIDIHPESMTYLYDEKNQSLSQGALIRLYGYVSSIIELNPKNTSKDCLYARAKTLFMGGAYSLISGLQSKRNLFPMTTVVSKDGMVKTAYDHNANRALKHASDYFDNASGIKK
jgi:hypothetical protein